MITTRLPIADIADHERTSALRRDLEQLSSDAGARLLRALGVNGHEAELRSASDEFRGHCLALTLLGSYLTDAYNGDIRRREEVSKRLARDEVVHEIDFNVYKHGWRAKRAEGTYAEYRRQKASGSGRRGFRLPLC